MTKRAEQLPIVCKIPVLFVILFLTQNVTAQDRSMVNFAHLRDLTESIVLNRDTVEIIHVYSNYPDYRWFDAADAGVEGTACVDDAARAAVVYLRHFELDHDAVSLARAQLLLKFILEMQAGDGQFYNFLYHDRTINTTGRTSVKSFGWWAARATWALGTGFRIFRPINPSFAGRLQIALDRCLPHIDKLLERYGKTDTVSGFRVPRWLLYDSGADGSSELLLGLIEYASVRRDTNLIHKIRRLADGIMEMQDGTTVQYPYGVHRSWETQWHMWGNAQTQMLATAGRLFGDSTMIASATREADGFFSRLLIDGFMKECDIAKKGSRIRFEQIAYAVRPMAVGLLRLYEATNRREYLVMAGLAGSWLFGNNVLNEQMYDPLTGLSYDGIQDSTTLNKNSGAESTIEALSTVLELEHSSGGARYLTFKKVRSIHTVRWEAALYRNHSSDEVSVAIDLREGKLLVLENEASRKFQEQLP